MRGDPQHIRNIRSQIAMVKNMIRIAAVVAVAGTVYGWMQPKPLVVAHKLVPTYSMMVGD